jgi:hypothetical protein
MARIRLDRGTSDTPPWLRATALLERGPGPHAESEEEHADFDDLDDAILWSAERAGRILVDLGERLSAGTVPVPGCEPFAGDPAARARAALADAHDRWETERAADADDDLHTWFVAFEGPPDTSRSEDERAAYDVASPDDVSAVHVRRNRSTGDPVWIVELEAGDADDAERRVREIVDGAFPEDHRLELVEIGLADHVDELLSTLE